MNNCLPEGIYPFLYLNRQQRNFGNNNPLSRVKQIALYILSLLYHKEYEIQRNQRVGGIADSSFSINIVISNCWKLNSASLYVSGG